jgi:hypothetical protein
MALDDEQSAQIMEFWKSFVGSLLNLLSEFQNSVPLHVTELGQESSFMSWLTEVRRLRETRNKDLIEDYI